MPSLVRQSRIPNHRLLTCNHVKWRNMWITSTAVFHRGKIRANPEGAATRHHLSEVDAILPAGLAIERQTSRNVQAVSYSCNRILHQRWPVNEREKDCCSSGLTERDIGPTSYWASGDHKMSPASQTISVVASHFSTD